MINAEQYLQLNRTFKSEVLGIRGNKQNVAQLKDIQKMHNFNSVGQALDFVLSVFTSIPDVSAFREHEQNLKAEIYALQNDNNEKNDVIKTLTSRIAELEQEKQYTSAMLTDVLKNEIETIRKQAQELLEVEITPSQFLFMMVDFVKNDPLETISNLLEKHEVAIPEIVEAVNDSSFPLRSTIEKLFPHLFNQE